jgi:hypothetical protein
LEREHKVFAPISYWRNEQNGQPVLNGTRQAYVVSGYGDGALVDLFRLTIERFRQDSILYELFDKDIDDFELNLRALYKKRGISRGDNLFDLFSELGGQLETAVHKLAGRIRKDTTVILHAAGTGGNKSLRKLFGPYSSFLNRFLLFLLYRCGAFSLSFDELTATVKDFGVPTQNVLCRHGAAAKEHVIQLFTDPDSVEGALKNLEQESVQSARRLWIPGYFPPPKRTGA